MMHTARTLLFTALASLAGAGVAHADGPATPPPADSVYQLSPTLTDQAGHAFPLAARRGGPQLVSMFYASCQHTCPMTIDAIRGVDRALDDSERNKLRLLMISFDPKRDTPALLSEVAAKHTLDLRRWTLASATAADARGVASVFGVRYRARADGEFDHNVNIVLLDADGRIVATTEKIGGGPPDAEFLAAVKRTLDAP